MISYCIVSACYQFSVTTVIMLITYLADNWKYSNAPEGERPFEKVVGLSKYGVMAGVLTGTYDCVLISQAYTFWKAVNCMSFWVIPFTAMTATFASVAYTVTKVRGKDGYANYILASLATSGVLHHWLKEPHYTRLFALTLMGLATIKKHGDLIGWNPLPLHPELEPGYIRQQYTTMPDFTILKDPRGRRPWE